MRVCIEAVVWALRAFLVITMIDTVYFGWHYVSDVIVGLMVGMAGAWVAEHFAAPEDEGEREMPGVAAADSRFVGNRGTA